MYDFIVSDYRLEKVFNISNMLAYWALVNVAQRKRDLRIAI